MINVNYNVDPRLTGLVAAYGGVGQQAQQGQLQVAELEGQQRQQQFREAATTQELGQRQQEFAADYGMKQQQQAFDMYRFDQAQRPSQRDQWMEERQEASDNRQFELQGRLNELRLTQAERIRMQHVETAIEFIRNAPDLSDAEKNQAITELQTGVNPLQLKLQRQQLVSAELQQTVLRRDNELRTIQLAEATLRNNRLEMENTTGTPQQLAEIRRDARQNINDLIRQIGPESPLHSVLLENRDALVEEEVNATYSFMQSRTQMGPPASLAPGAPQNQQNWAQTMVNWESWARQQGGLQSAWARGMLNAMRGYLQQHSSNGMPSGLPTQLRRNFDNMANQLEMSRRRMGVGGGAGSSNPANPPAMRTGQSYHGP